MQRRLGGLGEVEDGRDLHIRRHPLAELRQAAADLLHRGHGVGFRALADLHRYRRLVVEPGTLVDILLAAGDPGHVRQAHWRAVAHGDQQLAEIGGLAQAVVGRYRHLRMAVGQHALRRGDVGGNQRIADVIGREAFRSERIHIQLHAYGVRRTAEHLHLRHAGNLRYCGFKQRVGEVVELVRRQAGGGERYQQDGNLRGIELEVLRRGRHHRQIGLRRVDGRLHVARGLVGGAIEREADLHRRRTLGRVAIHIVDAGNTAQMALQRCEHGRCHGLRAGTRQRCRDVHAGKLQRRQRGHTQQAVGK